MSEEEEKKSDEAEKKEENDEEKKEDVEQDNKEEEIKVEEGSKPEDSEEGFTKTDEDLLKDIQVRFFVIDICMYVVDSSVLVYTYSLEYPS